MYSLFLSALLFSGCTDSTQAEPKTEKSFPDYTEALRLIDGELDLEPTLQALIWSSGFPIAGPDNRWLFIADDKTNGQQLTVAGLHDTPQAMTKGDGFHWLELSIEAPAGLHYSFQNTDNISFADPLARQYWYQDTEEISYVAPPLEQAHLERWPEATDGVVLPRTLRVLVPPGAGPWPLLIAQDGNNLFNPVAPWGGWRLQDAAAEQPGMLIAGIDNTLERMSEYTHTTDRIEGTIYGGGGNDYAHFVHETIRPHLEERYPTTGTTGLLGSSLGGLISLYINQQYPDEYDFVASLSGTLGWGRFGQNKTTIQELYLQTPPGNAVLFVDSGGSDGDGRCQDWDGDGFVEDDPNDSDNYCTNRDFADAMAGHGYIWDTNLYHWWEPEAPHNELAWAERVHRPLSIFSDLAN